MPKANKQVIIDAIVKEIELGTTRGKIVSVFGKKCHVTERTIDRYWKTANQQHKTRQDSIKTTLAALDTQAAIDARKKAIMSADERKQELSAACNDLIHKIQGKKKFTFFQGGKIVQSHNGDVFMLPIDTQAKVLDTIKGILAELNKMCGDYAPAKTEVKIDAKDMVIDFRKAQ